MADTKMRPLTEKEVEGLNKEYPLLATKLETQTIEQTVFLRKHIAKDAKLSQAQRNRLDQVLEQNGFKLKLFRVTDANVLQSSQVQVTYDIHDELYDYLRKPESELPRELRGFLDGGIVLDPKLDKDAAEDLMPLTGKTRTGVPKYDALIEAAERAKKGGR